MWLDIHQDNYYYFQFINDERDLFYFTIQSDSEYFDVVETEVFCKFDD